MVFSWRESRKFKLFKFSGLFIYFCAYDIMDINSFLTTDDGSKKGQNGISNIFQNLNSQSTFSFGPTTNDLSDTTSKTNKFTFVTEDDMADDDLLEDEFRPDSDSILEECLGEAPIPYGRVQNWSSQNRTLKFVLNPVTYEGIAWVDEKERRVKSRFVSREVIEQESKLYPAAIPGMSISKSYKDMVIDAFALTMGYEVSNFEQSSGEGRSSLEERIQQFVSLIIETAKLDPESNLGDALSIIQCFYAVRFSSSPSLTVPFLEWINHYTDDEWPLEDITDIMRTTPVISHPRFWDRMFHIAIRGLMDNCVATLQAARDGVSDSTVEECFELGIKLFKAFPKDVNVSQYSFRQWKETSAALLLKAGDISDTQMRYNVEKLFNIMRGDIDTILEMSHSWYEAIGAMLIYHDPTKSRLNEYYNLAIKQHPVDTTLAWEAGSAAVISGDILVAIQNIESLDLCLASSMSQFCKHGGLLDSYIEISRISDELNDPNRSSIADWLSLRHAQACLGYPDLCPVAIDMLRDIGTEEAIQTIAECLPRYVTDNLEQFDWAIGIAESLNLRQSEIVLHKTMAMKFISLGQYFSAFVEFDNAGDVDGLRIYCWKLFEETLVSQEVPGDITTIEAVTTDNFEFEISPLIRECLAPCAVLARFFECLKQGLNAEAAKYIVALFLFNYLPSEYYGLLVAMVIPLLSRTKPRVISTKDISIIITAVDLWENDQSNKGSLHSGMGLLEHSLALTPSNPGEYDWRSYFEAGISGDNIMQTARIKLAQEISRAYLDGV